MGCLRLLLALSVVTGHAAYFFHSPFLVNAKAAVVCFFVVSGFYMALVLREKYNSRAEFLVNRWLRIYVPYIAVTLVYGGYLYASGRLQTGWDGFYVNATLLGQDVFRMMNWLPTPRNDLGFDVIIIPQAWTLSVELQLYLIAAILFPLRWGIGAALATGIALRTWLYWSGYLVPPFGIMLSGNVLVFFALGGVSYLLYTRARMLSRTANASIALGVLAALAVYLYAYDGFVSLEAAGTDWRFIPLYGLIAALLPSLFALTKDLEFDRLIGELSYPTYLVHIAVIDLADHMDLPSDTKAWFTMALTLALATLMYLVVDRPLDGLRHGWRGLLQKINTADPKQRVRTHNVGG